MAIRVADVGTNFLSVVLRLREELCPLRRPFLVDLMNVRDANVEERTRPVRIGRGLQSDRGLVVSGPTAHIEDQPRIRDLHDDRVALKQNLPAEHRPIELPGPVLIGDDEKVSDDETLLRGREVFWVHLTPPFVESSARVGSTASYRLLLLEHPLHVGQLALIRDNIEPRDQLVGNAQGEHGYHRAPSKKATTLGSPFDDLRHQLVPRPGAEEPHDLLTQAAMNRALALAG